MKVGIVGTRGIPNRYGGFEQCAENLAPRLVQLGHDATVYCPHDHPFQESSWRGVGLRRVWYPENTMGPLATIMYDRACVQAARYDRCDVVLALGYTPASMFFPLLRRANIPVVTNMDGLEWTRSKWSPAARHFIHWHERLAARRSDMLVADNPGIQRHLRDSYGRESTYIPYGADHITAYDDSGLEDYGLQRDGFDLVVARIEPENNVRIIVEGHAAANPGIPLVVVGGLGTVLASELKQKYERNSNVRFLGGIYDEARLNGLRRAARYYFHGHSVGGTNPSLLEAMAAGCRIWIHENEFNRHVSGPLAPGFTSAVELATKLSKPDTVDWDSLRRQTVHRLRTEYQWDGIAAAYHAVLGEAVRQRNGSTM